MVKISKIHFMAFILFLLLNIFFVPSSNIYTNNIEPVKYFDRVKDTEYFDWSEAKILDKDYSFSTVYLTKKTEFKIVKSAGYVHWYETNEGIKIPHIDGIKTTQELIMLISNCAINKNGDILDVVIKINNVTPFEEFGSNSIHIMSSVSVPGSQSTPNDTDSYKTINIEIGSPILFQLHGSYSSCDFTMTYYKSGTYNEDTDSGELGNINAVNGFFGDVDVVSDKYPDNFFSGNEGFRPNNGSSTIFYDRNHHQLDDANLQGTILQESDNGLAIKSRPQSPGSFWSKITYWYPTTALMLTKDINSTYTFTYGGVNCGMLYYFASPYPYEISAPTKKATEKEVRQGEQFIYEISQYIPNNYYANLFNFSEIYDNLHSNSRFTKLTIKDTFDKALDIDKDRITITNESDVDVTDKFNISVNNNELVVTTKEDNFNNSTFYNHTYTIHVPVTLKSDISGITNLKNTAIATSKIGDEPDEDKPSNEVNVDIVYVNTMYKVIVNYLKEGTNEPVTETKILEYKLNDNYTTDYPTIINLELVSIPDNASGIVTGNLVVNYYYREQVIENPDTGANAKYIIIILTFPLIGLIYYFKKYHKKLYKI